MKLSIFENGSNLIETNLLGRVNILITTLPFLTVTNSFVTKLLIMQVQCAPRNRQRISFLLSGLATINCHFIINIKSWMVARLIDSCHWGHHRGRHLPEPLQGSVGMPAVSATMLEAILSPKANIAVSGGPVESKQNQFYWLKQFWIFECIL